MPVLPFLPDGHVAERKVPQELLLGHAHAAWFRVAASLDPDILLLDELFAVGDAAFQQQCTQTVREFRDRGKTILFVSHSPESVRSICHRVIVLEQGRLVYDGGVDDGLEFYTSLAHATAAPA